jgi:hypothetical protein
VGSRAVLQLGGTWFFYIAIPASLILLHCSGLQATSNGHCSWLFFKRWFYLCMCMPTTLNTQRTRRIRLISTAPKYIYEFCPSLIYLPGHSLRHSLKPCRTSVQDSLHGSNYSSRYLAEDGAVYPVEHAPKSLLGEPSISVSGTQR